LPTVDGWVAVNLCRASDLDAIPAVVDGAVTVDDPWLAIERFAAVRPAQQVTDRCQFLSIAAAVLDDPRVEATTAATMHETGSATSTSRRPVVVDLSSMWAGPLCARLLGRADMRVIKVESTDRPDGARAGDPRFFDWLHRGHENRVFDFSEPRQLAALEELIEGADVVIESSRPRALLQLGIDPIEIVAARPGRTWVSITGYGRTGDAAQRVAFGDDAAVAGGLVALDAEALPIFCGDAIADPMSGLFAAAAAFRSIESGGGHLIEVVMSSVAKWLATEA
jgi:crotonobetainyl-CoA:carnitine CoA-transferase CaiB-like acyl-CoA transferase